ncbi:MAG: UvrD-helicase domain-containing protein [Rhodothermales bacterium]
MERLPEDHSDRRMITEDLASNMIVRAGAGSGKTTALISRIVALLESGVTPSSIVAITFTRLAAAELKVRLYDELAERDMAFPEELYMGTIHAFCARLLRQRPFDIGVAPDFIQLEAEDAAEDGRRFWQRYLSRANTSQALDELTAAGCTDDMLTDLFRRVSEYSDLVPVVDEVGDDMDLESAVEHAMEVVRGLETLGPFHPDPDAVQSGVRKARMVHGMMDATRDADRVAVLQLVDGLLNKKGDALPVTLYKWQRPKALMKCVRDGLDHEESPLNFVDVIARHVRPAVQAWNARVHARATYFVQQAVAEFDQERRRSGRLTHDDLLRLAAELVGRSSEARAAFQALYRHLLVDEFQDTDPTQARMLFWLASGTPDLEAWSRSPLLPGRLFLVGDDKQSIYRFRRADFEVFGLCEQAIVNQGGRSLELTVNFRSTPSVCAWINQALSEPFTESNHQAPWQPLLPFRPDTDASRVEWMTYDGKMSAQEEARNEARTIARMIKDDVDAGRAEPGDFLILMRTAKRISVYVAELSMAGLPVSVSGGTSTGGSDVLASVCSILEYAASPHDLLAQVSALRSPMVGVSDRELLDWATEGSVAVQAALARLDGMASVLHDHGPHAALSRIAWEQDWWLFLSTRSTADVDTGMLQRILALFRDVEAAGKSWLHALGLLQAARDDAQKIPLHTSRKSGLSDIRIMTVHGAKGLQARTVFLANPSHVSARTPDCHFDSTSESARVVLPVVERHGFSPVVRFAPRNWPDIRSTEQAFQDAEAVRLLYVACTRAVERLVVTVRGTGRAGYWNTLSGALERSAEGPILISAQTPGVRDDRPSPATSVWANAQAVLDARRARIQLLSRERYRVVRPSDLGALSAGHALGERAFIPEGHGPGGKLFGQAVHTMFEWLVNQREQVPDSAAVRDHIQSFHAQPEWLPSYDDGMLAAARGLLDGPLWALIREAQDVLVEVPFTTGLATDGDMVQVVSGTVDLALRRGSKWTLVDFKTDRQEARDLVALHGPQIRTYVTCWRNMFDDDDVEACLWSTWLNRLVPVQEEAS